MKRLVTQLACLGMFVLVSPILVAQTTPSAVQTKEANIKAYISLMRKDIKRDKVSILTELMALDPAEAAKFWPVYNEYDQALTKLGDERVVFIRMFADNFRGCADGAAPEVRAAGPRVG